MVINELESRLIEFSGSMVLSDGKTNSIGESLTQRTGGDLNTFGVMGLRMAGGDRIDVLEICVSVPADGIEGDGCILTLKDLRSSTESL